MTSYVVNYLGDFAAVVALAILVFEETHDPLATAGLFIAAQFLPAFAAPLLTAHVDQFRPNRVLAVLYAGECLIFVALALVARSFSLPLVYLLVLADGILMLSARGITRAAINHVLAPHGLLRDGNGLLNIGFAFAGVAGAALGGRLVDAYGADVALALDAASFAVIAALVATVALKAAHVDERGMLERARGGLRHLRSNVALRLLVGGEGLAIFFFTFILPIEVVYAKETLETTDTGFGVLLASWSAGTVLGSLGFVVARRRGIVSMILISTSLIGLAYLGMAAAETLALACAFSVVGGAGNGIQWVAVVTAVQEATPAGLQARITGLLESAASLATGMGFLAGGVVTAVAEPPTTFAIAGAGVMVLVLGGMLSASSLGRSLASGDTTAA